MKKVCIKNNGSGFRGLIGSKGRRTLRGMYKVTFDAPRYGITYSLFFAWELKAI